MQYARPAPANHPPPRRGRACPARRFAMADADGPVRRGGIHPSRTTFGHSLPAGSLRRGGIYAARPSRPAPANHSTSVGAGHARPATLRRRPLLFCIVGRGLDPSAGRRGRRPLQRWPETIPTPIHARGGLRSGRPTISRSPYPVGEGFIPPAPLPVVLHLTIHSVGAAYMPPAPPDQHPPTIHHPVGAGHARPAGLRLYPFYGSLCREGS